MSKKHIMLLLFSTMALSAYAQKSVIDSLPGRVKTYYSPGRLSRAKATQQLVLEAISFYERQLPNSHFALSMYVVDKVQVPFYDETTRSLTVGTHPNQMAVPRFMTATANSPADTVDVAAVHELGHYFQMTLLQAPVEVRWANEFFATYFAVCFLQTKNVSLLPSASTGITPKYRSLEDFERLYYGVGGANYGWYQDQFSILAYALYPTFKTKLVQIAAEEYGPMGKKTPPMDLLQRLAPHEVANWLKGLSK